MKVAAKYTIKVINGDGVEIGYTINKMLIRPEGDLAPSKSNMKLGKEINRIIRHNH